MDKSRKMQRLQHERGDLNIVIPELLVKHNGSQKAVAQELGIAHSTVCLWLRQNGYKQRVTWERQAVQS